MIDYTNYKKFYSSGDEYNVTILDQGETCVRSSPLSSSLADSNNYVSEFIYSVDGYVRMFINGYYVEWEAQEENHGITDLTYDEFFGRLLVTIGGVGVTWSPVFEDTVASPNFTYDSDTSTVYKTLNGVNLSWFGYSYTPSPEDIAALTGEIVVGVGTLNEQYVALASEGSNFTGMVEVKDGVVRTFYTQQLLEPKRIFSTELAV